MAFRWCWGIKLQVHEAYQLSKVNFENGWKSEVAAELFDFYEAHEHKGNRVRNPVQIIKSIKDGAFYVIRNRQGEIIASTATFCHFNNHFEAGATRVLVGGYGFQKVFHWLRLVDFHLFEDVNSTYFTAVAKWNEKSIGNIEAVGFNRWKPTKTELAELGKLSLDTENDDSPYLYRITKENRKELASQSACRLLECYDNPIIASKYHEAKITLSLDIRLLKNNSIRKLLRQICSLSASS